MRNSILMLILFAVGPCFGQAVWQSISEDNILNKSSEEREIIPTEYSSFSLDFKRVKKQLSKATAKTPEVQSRSIEIELPMPNGKLEKFELYESSCMSPVLSAKFPSIKSYSGQGKENKMLYARIDYGSKGFHGVIHSPLGTVYVDPYFANPDENYISYFIKNHVPDESNYPMSCGETSEYAQEQFESLSQSEQENLQRLPNQPVIRRTYRLAVSTTGEWGASTGTKEDVLSRIVTGVNRLNMIYENSMAAFFELIDDNDKLIFLDGTTDPFENPSMGGELLGQNTAVINNIVGSGSYDIGHCFTIRCSDVGGVANPGVVCTGSKGNGISCVGNSNISAFVVNTVAHEVGHQFSGGHSWDNCPGSAPQRSANTAWEPGSGSTILSYAGSCGNQNNITGTNEDYFHVGNIGQIRGFMENSARCSNNVEMDNHKPVISLSIPSGLVIPIATPFELDGKATDIDGDELTYQWEQMDRMESSPSPLGAPTGSAPSFRSFRPTTESKRLFPRLPFIIGGIGSNHEVLPLYSRDLNFRFTVRDNHPGGGATVWENLKFSASDSAGPFRITTPNTITFLDVGQTYTVEWDVANTDNATINCQTVDLYLSLDNGDNFDILVLKDTPNDGSASFIVPNMLTNEGKFKVKASNNIFFQLSRSNVIIRPPSVPGFFIDIEQAEYEVCLPNQVEIEIQGTAFAGFDTPVDLEVTTALPAGVSVQFSQNPMSTSGNSKLIVDFSGTTATQSFDLTIAGSSENAQTVEHEISIHATGTDFSDLELLTPISGISGLDQAPLFEWTTTQNADNYTLEISKSPSFGATNTITRASSPTTSFLPNIVFDNSSLFYWRVVASNQCINYESEIKTFGTVSLDCKQYEADNLPQNISLSGTVEINAIARVFEVGQVADVNILNINGQHSNIIQVTGTLISPSGTKAVMFDKDCFASTNFNIGFDDQSPIDFSCPLTSGLTVKPKVTELSVFNGERIDGEWIFRINDNQSGEGGQFTSYTLELCASFEINNPFVVNNNVLDVKLGTSAKLKSSKLLIDDNDNFAEDLLYTIVINTSMGTLYLNGEAMGVGNQFTQKQLNDESIRYVHEGSENAIDRFVFTVIDGNGGWLDLTEFEINVDENIISSSEDLLSESKFEIYPNPSSDFLLIRDLSKANSEWSIQMYSLDGRLVMKDRMLEEKRLSMTNLNNGIYILKISNQEGSVSYRVSVAK